MNTQYSFKKLSFLMFAGMLFSILAQTIAFSQGTVRWTGGTSAEWSTAANWTTISGTPSTPPSSDDDVQIGQAAITNQPSITSTTGAVTIASLTYGSTAASTLTITNGGTGSLTVTGAVSMVQSANSVAHTVNVNDRTYTIGGNLSIGAASGNANGTSTVNVSTGTLNVDGSLALNNRGVLAFSNSGTVNLKGNFTNSGTFTASTSTFNCSGTSAQSIAGVTYNTLKSNNTAGVSLSAGTTLKTLTIGDVTSNSIFSDNGQTITLSASSVLNLTDGTYKLGSAGTATSFPGFTSITIAAGTTVEYASGVAQTVSGSQTYSNLTLSGAGTKTAGAALTVNGNFTNGSTFSASNGSHQIKGNFVNNGTFTASTSTITLNGTSSQNINGSNATTFNNLTVNNSSGVAVVTAPTVNGTLTVSNGTVTTNANTITLGSTASLSESAGATVLGNITITKDPGISSGSETFGNIGAEVSINGTALGNTTVTRKTGTTSSGNSNTSIKRYFDITPTTNTGLNAGLVFRYDESELNGQSENSLELYKSTNSGSTWANNGGTRNTTANTITLSGLDGFSRWTASDTSHPLAATPTPTTTSIDPTSKVVGETGFTLTVNGSNFIDGKSTVRFNGNDRTTTFVSNTQLTASILAGDIDTAGSFNVTVFNTGGGGSSTPALTFTVNLASTTTSLTSNLNPSTYGASVTFTAKVSVTAPGSGTPTGNIKFLSGVDSIGVGAISGDSATFSTSTLNAATHSITAQYIGDANYSTSTSSAVSQVVNKATPTATLAVNNSPQTYTGSGQSATVTISSSSVAGTVANILTGGAATQTNAGMYTVTADFVPNDGANYNTLTSQSAGNFVINKATPTATLAVSNSPQTYSGSVQSATVTISSSSVAGTVANILTGGAADQTNAGTYAVTADFVPNDGANYNSLTSQSAGNFVINKATPTATLAVNNSPQTYSGSGQSATVEISASSVAGTVANILTGGAATQTNAGTYAVTANFVPNDGTNYNTLTALSAGNFVINKA
ncbi:MAG: Ig-like domain repeat protein, partial [Ignavibacteriales bacterium]|nr:Ig-like domain repeat protein [Ignavibacteriales bacterium]